MNPLFSPSGFHEVKRLVLVVCLLLAWTAPAANMKLYSLAVGSCVYRNVTVLSFNTTDLYFTYEGGITSVKLRHLDSQLQKRFHYDPEAVAEIERQQEAGSALYMASIASNMLAEAQQATLNAQIAAATFEDSLADPVSTTSLIGKRAPAIIGGKWLGEKPELGGKLVLVAFWSPRSFPCRKYIPKLDALQKQFTGKLAVVGVTSDSEAEIARMTAPRTEFASMLDRRAEFRTAVGVTSIPYVMLVDPKGVVRYQGHPGAISEREVATILAKAAN